MANADALLRKAEKTLTQSKGWGVFTDKSAKLELAAEEFDEAANKYKIEEKYEKSGQVYKKVAEIRYQLDQKSDAAQALDRAFLSFNQVSPQHAARALEESITAFKEAKNLRRAAAKYEDLGKIYESIGDLASARDAWSQAAKLYMGENAEATANRARVKAAELTAILATDDKDNYHKAKQLFLEVAQSNLQNNALKYSVKEHLFHYGLCSVAFMDEPTISNDFRLFPEVDKQFMTTRENQLLEDMLESLRQQDPDMFQAKVNAYANLSPLKLWEETMIGRIEDAMRAAEEDFS